MKFICWPGGITFAIVARDRVWLETPHVAVVLSRWQAAQIIKGLRKPGMASTRHPVIHQQARA